MTGISERKIGKPVTKAPTIQFASFHELMPYIRVNHTGSDDILANVETLMTQTMKTTTDHYESFIGALNHYNDIVNANRVELNPPEADAYTGDDLIDSQGNESKNTDNLNLDLI